MNRLRLLSLLIFCCFSHILFGQFTTVQDGKWDTVATWGGPSPGYTDLGSGKTDITVNHYVTANNDLTFAANNSSATFRITDTLIVYGNVLFNKDAAAFVIESGTVIIVGDLTIQQKLEISSDGVLVVTGTFNVTVPGNSSNTGNINYSGGGTVYAGNYNGYAEDVIPGDGENSDEQQYLEDLLVDVDTASELQDIIDIIIEEDPELLPVTLRNFRHTVNGKNVLLQWATETEVNFEFFEIQRAGIGELFTTIGTVPGNGNSKTTKHYSWADESPLIGINYYRLVSNDYDGYREVFDPIVVIHEPEHFEINVYPNPVETGNRLWFSGSQTTKEVSMYMMDGSMVLDKEIVKDYLDIPEWLSPGIYLLSLNINGLSKQQKIIVK